MKNLAVNFKWFLALMKRLLKKPSFIVILLIIPLMTFAISKSVTSEESGILTCLLTSENMDCEIYNQVKNELIKNSTSVVFVEVESKDKAIEEVKSGKADCAWVFKDDLERKMQLFVLSKTYKPSLVEVITTNDNVFQRLSREKLYSCLYKALSFDVFKSFMNDKFLINDEELREMFDQTKDNLSEDVIVLEFLGAPEKKAEEANYLLSPLKGLLAVAMLLSMLSAMMYSLQDEQMGKLAMFPKSKRIALHYSGVLASCAIVVIIVLLSRFAAGDISDIRLEIISLLIYVFTSSCFAVFIGVVCKTPKHMCIAFPTITLLSLALCPIFVNLASFKPFAMLLPTYYYLMAVVDDKYLWHGLLYGIIVFVLSRASYKLLNRE